MSYPMPAKHIALLTQPVSPHYLPSAHVRTLGTCLGTMPSDVALWKSLLAYHLTSF